MGAVGGLVETCVPVDARHSVRKCLILGDKTDHIHAESVYAFVQPPAGERVQEIEIYLKFIGKFDVPMPEPTPEELEAEEARRQRRIRDHAKYLRQKERKRKIAEGLIVPGEPYGLVCQCCGEPFQSIRPNAKFCKPACREKFYRRQKRAAKQEKDAPPPEAAEADKIA